MKPLPDDFQPKLFIVSKGPVLGNESQLAGNGLPNNQTVKRVFMPRAGQAVEGSRFGVGKLKYGKTRLTDDLWKVIGNHAR